MKREFKIIISGFIAALYILNFHACFGQEPGKNDSGAALEEALKNYDSYKQKEQSEIAKKIHSELDKVTADWIVQAEKEKKNLIGTRIEQNWEKLALYFPISPAHYEYDLRGYRYEVIKNDVSKSESITSPYKAAASIKEELYVERSHSEDISDPIPYFFTVTTVYNLNFEYRQNKIKLINTDNKITNIENTAPDEITKWTI